MKQQKIPNKSPTGWWVVGILMENLTPGESRYWENMILFTGRSWSEIYKKAVANAKVDEEGGNQRFVGITNLLPVYDEFEDGAEILFTRIDDDACLQTVLSHEELSEIYG